MGKTPTRNKWRKQLESVAKRLANGAIIFESWNTNDRNRDWDNPDCYRLDKPRSGDIVPKPVLHTLITSGLAKRGHSTAGYWIATAECKERYGATAATESDAGKHSPAEADSAMAGPELADRPGTDGAGSSWPLLDDRRVGSGAQGPSG